MELKFRDLNADEIECRVGAISKEQLDAKDTYGKSVFKEKGFTLLLYKNARVDMALLDEVVGPTNWQREHKILGNDIYCRVGIYDKEKGQWIWREDAGAEANTEVEKSKASDSFKRACVNFGLGRCLYSAPFIWINSTNEEDSKQRYYVKEIDYADHKITKLVICNEKTNNVVYSYPKNANVSKNVQKDTKKEETNLTPQVNEPKGSITKHDLALIQEYMKALKDDDKFYAWVNKKWQCNDVTQLTETQGKAIVKALNLGK